MKKELLRKVFHFGSLLYLLGYLWLGRGQALLWLGVWIVLEGSLELYRLRRPDFNRRLIGSFAGIHRAREEGRVSGIFWTALGCWLVFAAFGAHRTIVTAAILYLVFGDAAAALAGKALGRLHIPLPGRVKSAEGSLACLTVCLACGAAVGLPYPAVWAGALAATVVELLAPPPDDNFWMPVLSGAAALFFL